MYRTVKNERELRTALLHDISVAMNVISEKAMADMQGETYKFYTKGTPQKYIRTGALGDTPSTTAINKSGKIISFNAYLDLSHQYTTGKCPPMLDVLRLADSGITTGSVGYLRPTLGKGGFWKASTTKMEKTLNSTMGKLFKKIQEAK